MSWNTKLTKREKEVIHLRYAEGKTLSEIGDIYGVTRERIRQVEQKALRKIEKANPEESCESCWHYWGAHPSCHHSPASKKPCVWWEPKWEKPEMDDGEKYDAYQEVWN